MIQLLCMRIKGTQLPPIFGTQASHCNLCHEDIWIAPSSFPKIKEWENKKEQYELICLTCHSKINIFSDIEYQPLDSNQIKELKAKYKNTGGF